MTATTAARSGLSMLPTFMISSLAQLPYRSSRTFGWPLLSARWKTQPMSQCLSFLSKTGCFFDANAGSALAEHGFSSSTFGYLRSSNRRNATQITKFSTSAFPSSCNNATLSGDIEAVKRPAPHSSAVVSSTVAEPAVSGIAAVAKVAKYAAPRKKSEQMCYYHSQGLCTMKDDPVHLAKYCHEFPDLSVKGEDLKKVKVQPFDYFLVLDLEGMVEILEFPVVMIDTKTLEIVDHFHRFVKPAKMTDERLRKYIKGKYGKWGLDRVWHDTATPFTEVLPVFEGWLESHGLWDPRRKEKMTTAAFVTCGNWDIKTKMPEQCVTSEIDLPTYFNDWINLKDIYYNFYKFKATGMLPMMRGLKMPLIGTHHVGLDDAYNISRICQRMLVQGVLFQITAKRNASDPKAVKFTFRFRIK